MTAMIKTTLGSAITALDGTILRLDDDFCTLLSMPRQLLVGSRLPEIFQLDFPSWPSPEERAFHYEINHLRSDETGGDWIEVMWLRIVGKRLEDEKTFVVLVEDMSPSKARLQVMKELQQRYATIINASHSPMAILQPNGNLADCNQAAVSIANIHKRDLIGNPSWVECWLGGDHKLAAQLHYAINQARDGKANHVLISIRNGIASHCEFEISITPIHDSGSRLSYIFLEATDVTQLRRRTAAVYEEVMSGLTQRVQMLEHGVDHASDHIVWFDLEGILMDANPSLAEGLGYAPDQLRGMSFASLFAPEASEDFASLRVRSEADGEVRLDAHLHRLDGSTYPVELIMTLIEKPAMICAVIRDISERVRAQGDLQASLDQIAESKVLLEHMTFVTAHDLQEPVRQVVSFCQLLERTAGSKLEGPEREYLDFIIEGGRRIHSHLSGLLTFLEIGHQDIALDAASLIEVITQAQANLLPSIKKSGAVITTAPMDWLVQGDRELLIELFQQLLSNAIHFTQSGTMPRITISGCRDKETAGELMTISISDNGIGIEEDYFDDIFAPFKHLPTGQQRLGSGLGLSICRRIIERHGGRIWVTSNPGKGSVFHFTIRGSDSAIS